MPYRFDSELAALVEITPHAVRADITASRARAMEVILAATREIDLTGVNITDTTVPGPPDGPDVAVRIYKPLIGTRPTAAVLHLHGGGFVSGALGTDHRANIDLSRSLGAVVISVDYRLAPENPYPAAIEDCYAALLWTVDRADRLGVDVGRIAVHGAQSGAGLAAALTLLARDRGGPALCCQCLVSPELDDRGPGPGQHSDLAACWDAYLGAAVAGTAGVPAYAAPARATDLHGLPPAYVSVQEGDRLLEQGVAYADRLRATGVPVRLRTHPAAAPRAASAPLAAPAPPGAVTVAAPVGAASGRCVSTPAPGGRHRHRAPGATHGTHGSNRERDDRVAFLHAALGARA